MRILAALLLLCAAVPLRADAFTLRITAPEHTGQVVSLYRFDDLFTLRTVRLSDALIGDDGKATLAGTAEGTLKLRVRIGDAIGDLYVRAGSTLHIRFPLPDPRTPRSLNGTTRVELEFHDIDPLDINALTTDLNDRIDAFISEDLATDQIAGMQALEVQRRNDSLIVDSLQRPATLFVMPTWSAIRVDTFERKLRRFYRDVNDPWFAHFLEYSVAGLRHGPRVNDKEQQERYLKGKPVLYDDPEYVRFVRSFFSEQLPWIDRYHGASLQHAFATANVDSLRALFAMSDFLRDDTRLCELVMLDQLYQMYNSKLVQHDGADSIFAKVAASSAHAEHRTIAANMLWDLTAMRVGNRLPALRLEDLQGNDVSLDSLLSGSTCLVITAGWCTYCELEMNGLETLWKEYNGIVPIVAISLDEDLDALKRYIKAHPGQDFRWLHAVGEQRLREELRIRSLPVFYLLNDGVLARSPAAAPSAGLGALFHQAKVEAEKGSRIKVWDD